MRSNKIRKDTYLQLNEEIKNFVLLISSHSADGIG